MAVHLMAYRLHVAWEDLNWDPQVPTWPLLPPLLQLQKQLGLMGSLHLAHPSPPQDGTVWQSLQCRRSLKPGAPGRHSAAEEPVAGKFRVMKGTRTCGRVKSTLTLGAVVMGALAYVVQCGWGIWVWEFISYAGRRKVESPKTLMREGYKYCHDNCLTAL